MSFKKGVEDGREGKPYEELKPDLIDRIGLGLDKERIDELNHEYRKGYQTGSQQRLSDNSDDDDDTTESSSSGK